MAADEVKVSIQLLVVKAIIATETDMEPDHVGVVIAGAEAGEVIETGDGMAHTDAVDFPCEGVAGSGIGDEVLFVLHLTGVPEGTKIVNFR